MAQLDLDWRQRGTQRTYLRLHVSSNRSAWGEVAIPVHCFRGEDGPSTLLLGGVHGDEYEAPLALSSLARRLDPEGLRGTIIIVPAVNLPAVEAGQRLTPLDGRDLNRAYPGNPLGSLTERLADAVASLLAPHADHVVDLHSGGRSLRFLPCMFVDRTLPNESRDRAVAAARCFPTPCTVLVSEPHAALMLDGLVTRAGKLMLASEFGGSGLVSASTLSMVDAGLDALLQHLGHTEARVLEPVQGGQLLELPVNGYLRAPEAGLFAPAFDLGMPVAGGDQIGTLHRIADADAVPRPVYSPIAGIFLAHAGQGLVARGDVVGLIGKPADLETERKDAA